MWRWFGILGALLMVTPAWAQDADGDGVPNPADAFPCDASVAAEAFAPARDGHGMIIAEDQWPRSDDLDFNDAVLTYNLALALDAQGRAVRMRATFNALALGGTHDNGMGWHLPVPRSAIASVMLTIGSGQPVALVPSASDLELTVRLVDNLRSLFGGTANQINSIATQPASTGQTMVVDVTFASPTALPIAGAPYDVYLFRTSNPGHEIHTVGFGGTANMNAALFGTADDASTVGRWFVDTSNVPFMLLLPVSAHYPREAVSIDRLFPRIAQFAASGGAQSADFYSVGIDAAHAYSPSTGSRPAAPAIPVQTADRSCIPSTQFRSCAGLLAAGFTTSGVYSVDPDLGGPAPAYPVYCDQVNDGGGWSLLSRAQYPAVFTAGNWENLNAASPADVSLPLYSALNQRGWHVDGAAYTMRLAVGHHDTIPADFYTGLEHTNIWSQRHDAFTQSTNGSDFTHISGTIPSTCGGFVGLHSWSNLQISMTSDADSTDNANCWWHQIVPTGLYTTYGPGYLDGYEGASAGGSGNTGRYDRDVHQWQSLWYRAPVNPTTAPTSCLDLLLDGQTASGVYSLDVDGSGPATAQPFYCDMTTDGGGWTLLMRATYPAVFTTSNWSNINATSPANTSLPLYSALNTRTNFARDGAYELRVMVGHQDVPPADFYTGHEHRNVWRQSHDPFTQSTNGSDFVHVSGLRPTTCGGFNGLHSWTNYGVSMTTDVDSTDNPSCWWHQIVPMALHTTYGPGYLDGFEGASAGGGGNTGRYDRDVHQWQTLWVR